MDQQHTALYLISVAAERSGMHPQTLRIYERKGLVQPSRTSGGSRRYSDADIALLRRIAELTSEGLNLAGVKRILALEYRIEQLEREVAGQEASARTLARAVRETERSQRRDLVPLSQTVTIYGSH